MSYLLVNAQTTEAALLVALKMKTKLERATDKVVRVVQDIFPQTDTAQKLKAELEMPFTPVSRRLSILMGFRSYLLKNEILPALDNGEIVLHVNGILGDHKYIPENRCSFVELLKQQLEIIEKTGRRRAATPIGSIYCSHLPNANAAWNNFRYRARKLEEAFSQFRCFPYRDHSGTVNDVVKYL